MLGSLIHVFGLSRTTSYRSRAAKQHIRTAIPHVNVRFRTDDCAANPRVYKPNSETTYSNSHPPCNRSISQGSMFSTLYRSRAAKQPIRTDIPHVNALFHKGCCSANPGIRVTWYRSRTAKQHIRTAIPHVNARFHKDRCSAIPCIQSFSYGTSE